MHPIRAVLLSLVLILPLRSAAVEILLLSTGSSTLDLQTQVVLQNAGHNVTIGSPYTTFTGTALTGVDVVLLFPNSNWNAGDMPLLGQNALVSFVQSGGGLITSEWTNWKVASNSFTTLAPILPVVATTQYTGGSLLTYTPSTSDAVLQAGLSGAFTFATDDFSGVESFFAAKPSATVFFSSSGGAGGAGVVGWDNGAGRVLQISTVVGPVELANNNYATLLQNSVNWSAQSVPEPSTFALVGLGVLALLGRWYRRTAR